MRKLKLFLLLWLTVFLSVLTVTAQGKREAVRTFTHNVEFSSHGLVQLIDSFGEVKIEAWDKEEVSVELKMKSQKLYTARDLPKAEAALNRIRIETEQVGEGELLVIRTVFPSRTPFRLMRGKSNADLEYLIKMPRTCGLTVKHDIGEVRVTGVTGDIHATSDIGEISVEVPDDRPNTVDARAKIGNVETAFDGKPERPGFPGLGAKLTNGYAKGARRLYLRIGIGEIQVKKLEQKSE